VPALTHHTQQQKQQKEQQTFYCWDSRIELFPTTTPTTQIFKYSVEHEFGRPAIIWSLASEMHGLQQDGGI
jgi:hypothetical protein